SQQHERIVRGHAHRRCLSLLPQSAQRDVSVCARVAGHRVGLPPGQLVARCARSGLSPAVPPERDRLEPEQLAFEFVAELPALLGRDVCAAGGTSIRWSADFTTSDGLATPKLQRGDRVYDLVGPVPGIPYLSYGLGVLAAVVLGTAGYGVVIRRRFAVEDVF